MTLSHLVIVSERLSANDFSLTICGSILLPIRLLAVLDLIELQEFVRDGSKGFVEMVKGDEFFLINSSSSCSILKLY